MPRSVLPAVRKPAAIVLLAVVSGGLSGLSPDDALWDSAVESIAAEPRPPEDAVMGPLADFRNPDSRWAAAVAACETAFQAIRSGEVPEEVFLERMKSLLSLEFGRVLAEGPLEVYPRYGLPLREGERVAVPVRVAGRDEAFYGYIYLVRTDEGEWRIDQWALDLTRLTGAEEAETGSE